MTFFRAAGWAPPPLDCPVSVSVKGILLVDTADEGADWRAGREELLNLVFSLSYGTLYIVHDTLNVQVA